jgi:hypothetical protein
VLFLSFANIKEIDYQTARRKICQTLSSLYSKYQFLLDEGCLNEREEDFFRSVSVDMDDVATTMAIHELCFYLSRYYGKRVIALLDEYDTPIQEAYVSGFWDRLVPFMRSMLTLRLKRIPAWNGP